MAKLLKKRFGLGSKKAASSGSGGGSHSQRSDYSPGAQKSNSAQDLVAQSPTRYHQPGVVLSASSHHEFLCDTHSLKSVASDGHSHCCCKHHGGGHACCR